MKSVKNKLAVVIIILSVTFLSLIAYSASRQKMSFVENGVGVTINSVQGIFYSGFNKIKSSFKFITNISDVKTQNEELLKTNMELQNKVLEYDNLKQESERLRTMLNFSKAREEYNYVGADIIGISGNNFLDGFIINKG